MSKAKSFFSFLEIWHQYDDTIYREKNWKETVQSWIPGLKSLDAVEGRAVATFAMLPHWKGFCVDDAGETMTAWEAIEQVQNVAHCMTKSQTKEGIIVLSSVPQGFHFKKVRRGWF